MHKTLRIAWVVTFSFVGIGAGRAADNTTTHVRSIDATHSTITLSVGKQGLFAFAADEHQVVAPIGSGSYDETAHVVELSIDAAKLQVQDPPSRHDKVQANMLGPLVLDVAKYPTISFRSTKFQEDSVNRWDVTGDLTLHGETHPITVHVDRVDESHFSGSAVVTQSRFGITPLRVAGGAVRVKDDVKVAFEIALK